MKTRILIAAFVVFVIAVPVIFAQVGPGNPTPGYPHDTIMIHVQKAASGPKTCDGGHSIFLRHDGTHVMETDLYITMIDWVQVDNDGDGLFDEDPIEDPVEDGAETTVLDCDGFDGVVRLQIRDTNPAKGVISTQAWFIRMVGKPEQNLAFSTIAGTVTCALDALGNMICSEPEWVPLAYFNLKDGGCVKQVKLGGKNLASAGGRTPYCDITEGFLVDVDTNNDGTVDYADQSIFSVAGCLDDPATLLDESSLCPLGSLIWEIDPTATTLKATAQIFVGHTGAVSLKTGKVTAPVR